MMAKANPSSNLGAKAKCKQIIKSINEAHDGLIYYMKPEN